MNLRVLLRTDKLQVLAAIIGLDTVDMVNEFVILQRAAKLLLHDQAMLKHRFAITKMHANVAVTGQVAVAYSDAGVTFASGATILTFTTSDTSRRTCE